MNNFCPNCKYREQTVRDIISAVCQYYDIPGEKIQENTRSRKITFARQVAMFLSKKHTEFSCVKIGSMIGEKDHSTVVYACNIIKGLYEVDKEFRKELDEIENSFLTL